MGISSKYLKTALSDGNSWSLFTKVSVPGGKDGVNAMIDVTRKGRENRFDVEVVTYLGTRWLNQLMDTKPTTVIREIKGQAALDRVLDTLGERIGTVDSFGIALK